MECTSSSAGSKALRDRAGALGDLGQFLASGSRTSMARPCSSFAVT